MNTYESMLLNDAAKLESTITSLINSVINNSEEARAVLAKVSEVIDFDYEITCDATFQPYGETLYSQAHFDSIEEYISAEESDSGNAYEYENQYGICWGDSCDYGEYELDKTDASVSVSINGLTLKASEEARATYNAKVELEKKCKEKEAVAELVKRLRKQLEEAEARLED